MADILVLAAVFLLVAAAVYYLVQEKKKGKKCVGCPMAAACSKRKAKC